MEAKVKKAVAALFQVAAQFEDLKLSEKVGDQVYPLSNNMLDVAFDLMGVPEEFRTDYMDELIEASRSGTIYKVINLVLKDMEGERKETPELFV